MTVLQGGPWTGANVRAQADMGIGGSNGAQGKRASLGVQILSISCSFWGKINQIIAFLHPPLELAPARWGNPGSATDGSKV